MGWTPARGGASAQAAARGAGPETYARTAALQGQRRSFPGMVGSREAAALYHAAFSIRETGIEGVWVVDSLDICASLLVHSVSATLLTKLYGRLPKNV